MSCRWHYAWFDPLVGVARLAIYRQHPIVNCRVAWKCCYLLTLLLTYRYLYGEVSGVPHEKGQGAAFSFDNLNHSWLGAVELATFMLERADEPTPGVDGLDAWRTQFAHAYRIERAP